MKKEFAFLHRLFSHKRVLFLCAVLLCAVSAFGATYTWTGATSTAWDEATNWTSSDGGSTFPGNGDNVTIPDTALESSLYPVLSTGVDLGTGTVTLEGGASLTAPTTSGEVLSAASLAANGAVTISGNITTTGTQTYTGAVTLNGHTSITTTDSNVTFSSTVQNGGGATHYNLTASIARGSFSAAGIGAHDPSTTDLSIYNLRLGTVTVNAATINLTSYVRTTGLQDYDGPVSTTGAFVFNAGSANVDLSSTFTGTGTFNAAASTITFGGAVNDFTSFTVTGVSDINANITTSGYQTYNGEADIDPGVNLTTATSTITFGGNVTSTGTPTLTASTLNFTKTGSNQIITTSSQLDFSGNVKKERADVSLEFTNGFRQVGEDKTVTLGGRTEATNGNLELQGNIHAATTITLAANTTNGQVILGGSITSNGSDETATPTITARQLSFSSSDNQNINVSGALNFTGAISKTGTNTLSFANGLTHVGASDPITLQGTVSATSGDLSFQGNLRLANGTTLQTDITADTFVRLYGNVANSDNTGSAVSPTFTTPQLIFSSSDNHTINIQGVFTFSGTLTKDNTTAGVTTITNGFTQTGPASLQGLLSTGTGNLTFTNTITLTDVTTLTAGGTGNVDLSSATSLARNSHNFSLIAEGDDILLGYDPINVNSFPNNVINCNRLVFTGTNGTQDITFTAQNFLDNVSYTITEVQLNNATGKSINFTNGFTTDKNIFSQGTISANSNDLIFQGEITLDGTTDFTVNNSKNINLGDVDQVNNTGGYEFNLSAVGGVITLGFDIDDTNLPETINCTRLTFQGGNTPSTQTINVTRTNFAAAPYAVSRIQIGVGPSRDTTFTNGFESDVQVDARGYIRGDFLTFNGTLSAGTPAHFSTTTGNITFANAVTTTNVTTVTAGGNGDIVFTEDTSSLTINSGSSLALTAEGDTITLGCDIGGASVNVPSFTGANLVFTGKTGAGQTITVDEDTFNSFTGTVRINNDNTRTTTFTNGFTQNGGSAVTVYGRVNATSGNLSFNGAVIADSTNPITLNASGIVRFQGHFGAGAAGNDDAPNPSITASVLDFGSWDAQIIRTVNQFVHTGEVTFTDQASGSLSTVTFTNGFSQLGGAAVTMEGTVIASDNGLSFTGPVELTRNTTLTADGQDITFASTISGAANLTTTVADNVTFGGTIGSGAGANLTLVDVTATTINLNGGTVTTAGSQTYRGNVTLGTATTLDANGDGNIEITGTVTGNNNSLRTKAASNDITFGANISGVTAFSSDTSTTARSVSLDGTLSATSVDVTATNTNINGGSVTTTGAQRYNGNVIIATNPALLSSSAAGNIGVTGTTTLTTSGTISTVGVVSLSAVDGPSSLTVYGSTSLNPASTVTFGGAVGTTALASLDVTATTININGGSVSTTGAQTYTGAVVLGGSGSDTNLTSSGSGNIEFGGAVSGAKILTVSATGDTITYAGDVTGLSSLGSTATTININGGRVSTNGAQTYNGAVVINSSSSDSTEINAPNGPINFEQTLNALTGQTESLTIATHHIVFTGTVGNGTPFNTLQVTTTNVQGITFSDEVRLGATTTLTANGDGSVTFSSTVTGPTSGATRNLTVTATSTISFGDAISNFNNITANAGVSILFLSSVQAAGTLTLTAADNTETDQSLAWSGIQFNGAVSANSLVVNTADVYIGNASAFTITTGTITFPAHLFIMADATGDVVSFDKTVDVGESLVIRGGGVNFASGVDVTNDLAIFGSGLVSATSTPDGSASIWSYTMADSFTASGAYDGTRAATNVIIPFRLPNGFDREGTLAGSISNLGSTTVGNNFYINGGSIANGSLDIPNNDSASVAFAEARHTTINNVTVTGGVIAAAPTVTTQGSSVNHSNISTSRPTLEEAYTVSDNMIYVRFSEAIENTNGEIGKAFSNIRVSTGGTYSGGAAFNGAFSDADGTALSNTDTSEFYLRVANDNRWNTDATGTSGGALDSTDRSGTHRTTVPSIHIPIALTNVYETLRSATKNRIATVNHTGTTDGAQPVLAAVYTGQEAYVGSLGDTVHYDAHNFIELRFSEAVDIRSSTSAGSVTILSNALNQRVSDVDGDPLTTEDAFGVITQDGNALEIEGLLRITNGTLQTGSRDKVTGVINNTDNTVHAFYRRFSVDGTSAIANQTHRLRISIAGYKDGTVPVQGSSTDSNYYPGFIDNAVTPQYRAAIVTSATAGTNLPIITEAGGGLPLDTSVTFYVNPTAASSVGALYGPWDTSPPSVARVDWDTGAEFEILGPPDSSGAAVARFEFHFHDNTYDYTTTPAYEWTNASGWNGEKLDVIGGSRPDYETSSVVSPDTAGGIRASSLVGVTDAFSIPSDVGGGPVVDGTFESTYDRSIQDTDFFTSGTGTLSSTDDTLYLTLYPNSNALDPLLQYNFTYDVTKGAVTDLAGNRLRNTPISSANLVAPVITLTVAPYTQSGTQEIFVYFNKALDFSGEKPASVKHADLSEMAGEFTFYNDAGFVIGDLEADEARIAFSTETSTGLILTLDRHLTEAELFTINLQADDATTTDLAIFGENGARVSAAGRYPVTYFGVNTVFPLNAVGTLDSIEDGSAGDVTVFNFDGTKGLYAHRDITMEVAVENTVVPLNDLHLSPILWLDSNAMPLTYSERYKEETGQDITFWMPTATDPQDVFSDRFNSAATDLLPISGSDDRYVFSIGINDIQRDSGDTMQFLFEMGKIKTSVDGALSASANTPLYHINIPEITDLQNFSMFAFKVFDETQAGGSTILNNVINVNNREEVLLEVILPTDGNLNISVLTADGNVVKYLSRGRKTSGNHYFTWDGTNNAGNPVARGIYFVRIVGPGIDETRKVMAVKE